MDQLKHYTTTPGACSDPVEWLLKHNGDFARVIREGLEVLNSLPPNGKSTEDHSR